MTWVRAFASVAIGSATVACSILVSTAGLSGGDDPIDGAPRSSVDSSDGTVGIDAPDATPSFGCDITKPFRTPIAFPAPIKTDSYEFAGAFSPDRLTLYFASDRGSTSEIYVSTRGSIDGAWSTPEKIDLGGNASNMVISDDGLTLSFDSDRGGSRDLYRARRASLADPFVSPAPLSGLNSGTKLDIEPWLSADGERIYFATDRNGGLDLYIADHVSGDTYTSPRQINEISSTSDEEDPEVTADELTIVFATRRNGGAGGSDIWIAHRMKKGDPWGEPEPIVELDTSADEFASWLSADGCAIILERVPSGGNADLYFAERPR